ncbi:MAG: TetR/AcrR family transcriptional regulator [Gammaproteobacteria bacterium]|nr:TetR/AcrR family transcriptional regulator [Gammaproteobacteria bacterium]MBU1646510.1 TetR/AcrR family transcriptional regulator [Gammaproteobacteria bacterium]MBU1971872.1 TetR/AcrR family transcriptional regulator [Gammaproteobacteria bacterium]
MATAARPAPLDRAAWIRGAFAIVADDGFDGLRVEALAKRLKVTKGSFYWHFKDRDDLFAAVLSEWRDSRIADIRKQTAAQPGQELAALHHTIDVYAAARNRKGIAIEAGFRLWARQDAATAAVVEEVDAERLACTCRLFRVLGLGETEAAARSVLLYAYVFGYSMMQCGRFAMDAAAVKDWIGRQIATG